MTSVTPKRRRRLAFMAAGTAAAMVLLPATGSAQQENPLDDVVNQMREVAGQIQNGQAPNVTGPAAPSLQQEDDDEGNVPDGEFVNPGLGAPDEDDDSAGHETDDPAFPDGGRGEVADVELGQDNETDIAEITEYEAEITDDGRSQSRVTVLGLLGDEIVGSSSSSDGENQSRENPTGAICEGTGGALCLNLLYHETSSTETEESLNAFAQGGVLALCLGGSNAQADATYECTDALLTTGVAEGAASAERDDLGNTVAASTNETANLCLGGSDEGGICEGLGLQVLHSESNSSAVDGDFETDRNSYLVGIDEAGNRTEILSDPAGLALPPGCGGEGDEGPALLCLFINQGESFIFSNGAASAQEALHLDLLRNTPIAVLAELGKAESVARQWDCEPSNPEGPCPGDGDGEEKPECDDGRDNDGDDKIDFPKDPECDSPEDDSEANGKHGAAGVGGGDDELALTGADVAPMLAGGLALIGLGALSMAATRRRVGKHMA